MHNRGDREGPCLALSRANAVQRKAFITRCDNWSNLDSKIGKKPILLKNSYFIQRSKN